MNEKELEELEKQALSLHDAKDRNEALKALAELRSLRMNLDREVEVAMRKASQGPARETASALESLRLYRRLKSQDLNTRRQAAEEIRLKRENEDRLIKATKEKLNSPVYRNQIKASFRSRKYLFRAITLLLVVTMFLVIAFAPTWGWTRDGTVAAVVLGFALFYWYAGERLWRCPACNYKLALNPRYGRSTAKSCPRCDALLS